MISGLNQNSGVAVKFKSGISDVRKDIMWNQRERGIYTVDMTVVWDGVCGVWEETEGVHRNTQRPNYLGKQARTQNQTLCHWGRSKGGGLRSVFGASSSSGQGGSEGLQGKEKQTDDHCYSPCPSHLKLTLRLNIFTERPFPTVY